MTIIFKSKFHFTEKDKVKEFYEKEIDNNVSPVQWAYWAGWMDSDGSFSIGTKKIELDLVDQGPTESFAKTFGGSLRSRVLNPNLYKNKNPKTLYRANLTAQNAAEFSKRIHKYLLLKNHKCKNFLKLMGIESNADPDYDCSDEIFIAWLTGFIEGDGGIYFSGNKKQINYTPMIVIYSDSYSTLKYIGQRLAKMNIETNFIIYDKKGYDIFVAGKISQYKRNVLSARLTIPVVGTKKLAKLIYPHMTLHRKKEKCLKILLELLKVPEKQMTVKELNENINQQKGTNNA
jgi:hypothetical protein